MGSVLEALSKYPLSCDASIDIVLQGAAGWEVRVEEDNKNQWPEHDLKAIGREKGTKTNVEKLSDWKIYNGQDWEGLERL